MTRSDGRSPGPGTVRIAVDLLGGDEAPAVVVDGALQTCGADPDLHLLLVGPRLVADEVIGALDAADRARVAVLAVDRGVGMGDPVAHGADPETSIGACMLELASRRVDAVVSAGASGATVAAAVMAVGRMGGVRRPALVATLPGARSPATGPGEAGVTGALVLLDVGAGMQVKPVDLVQYAVLGVEYSRLVAAIPHPRVGLLSVGAEPGKGDRLRRAADAALRLHPLPDASYVGMVEGGDVVTGARADVIVTDGFTGNVLLKGVEAASARAFAQTAVPSTTVPSTTVPSTTVPSTTVPSTTVPRAAALLGVAGTVIVCHGAASGEDVASGVALAARLVRDKVVARLGAVGGLRAAASPPADRHGGRTADQASLAEVPM